MPFAIDLTYNTDSDKMHRKFRWRHYYGKKKNAPEEVSEFGEKYVDRDYSGKEVLKTRPLLPKHRHGLKIPGFASAKYYEDRDHQWDSMIEKGRIKIMPRFIVGYSPEIAGTLAGGMPTTEYRAKYGEEVYKRKRREYEGAEKRAKWCTLLECHKQAADIRFMLEHMDAEETKWMRPEELEKAKKMVTAMELYFAKAIESATKKAESDPEEMAARKYADRDEVCQAIMQNCERTYVLKIWD